MTLSRRTLLAALPLTAAPLRAAAPRPAVEWHALGADVKAQMKFAWDNYREHAWGKDEIRPISATFSSFPLKGHHLGLSLVEAMDTLWVMGLDAEFADALQWVKTSLNFDVDGEVSVFETSIRLLGGLLSAHHACGDPRLVALAKDLADRLLPTFNTPTGFPYRFVNLRTGAVRDPKTNPAEIGTYLPEWGTLAKLTGDRRYYDIPKKAQLALFARRSKIGLFGDGIHAETGEWTSRRATVGSYADSWFEYLWDGWQLFGDADCRRMYDACTAAILKYQQDRVDGRLWIADVDFETGARVSREQDELASFYGGLLAQGGAHATGAAVTMAWSWLQDRFGVLPEAYDYGADKVLYPSNSLRPELADSAFNLWLLDRDPRWREIGRTHFLAMKENNKAPYGYADLADVTTSPKKQKDHCPGYWWSEQMKYYYLLFSDTKRFDYKRNYLSTEGNVLLGFRRP